MGDYNLSGLNARDFEHLTQALAKKIIAAGVTPFGDGPDGGREATFQGKMDYPARASNWDGYLVIQCKFRKKPTDDKAKDVEWTLNELRKEIKKYSDPDRKIPKPEYYLFVTNLSLTAVSKRGGKDRVRRELGKDASGLDLKGYDIWSYDELCRFIDDSEDVRRAYAGFITTGDVLDELMKLAQVQTPDFARMISRFIQKRILHDQAAKLESAGQISDKQIQLANVFVDLPAVTKAESASIPRDKLTPTEMINIISTLLEYGSYSLREQQIEPTDMFKAAILGNPPEPSSRAVIIGGPGQGKSTVGQYLCQLYRALFIKNKNIPNPDQEAKRVAILIEIQCAEQGLCLPNTNRFPIRILLKEYATMLAVDPSVTLLEYIRREVTTVGAINCSMPDFERWFETIPWVIILDGFDEVPASSNRAQILKEIENFRIDTTTINADLRVCPEFCVSDRFTVFISFPQT